MNNDTKNSHLVSVVITTYNRASVLEPCLDSILGQNYNNFEVIVVDDCSSDSTSEIFKKEKYKNITYIRHEKNQGVQNASNTGYSYVKGEYLAFTGDDDIWIDKDKISKQVQVFENDKDLEYGVVTCDVNLVSSKGKVKKGIKRPKNLVRHILNSNGIIYGSAALLRRAAFEMCGKFAPELPKGTDSDVYRRIILLGYNVYFSDEVMVDYMDEASDKMTNLNLKGIDRSIVANRYKLTRYQFILGQYPSVKSNINYNLGNYYFLKYQLNKSYTALILSKKHYKMSYLNNWFNLRALLKFMRISFTVLR